MALINYYLVLSFIETKYCDWFTKELAKGAIEATITWLSGYSGD